MQNLMAIRISFRLLVNGVPHGKNKATIKLVDVYVLDVFAVFEQCVRAWLHFQSASVRRTIQDTNCGFNLTSNIKNMRLGVKKVNACMQHALRCQHILHPAFGPHQITMPGRIGKSAKRFAANVGEGAMCSETHSAGMANEWAENTS